MKVSFKTMEKEKPYLCFFRNKSFREHENKVMIPCGEI
jgi:hypothetical protein